jgi:hypothetical protein
VAKELQNFGMSPRRLTEVLTGPAASRAALIEAQGLAQEGNPPIPASTAPVSRETGQTAAQMLKAQPPAPATRGTNFNPRLPTTPAVQPGQQQQVPLMYPAMFPNDPISGLLQARQAQIQGRPQ